MIWLNLIELQSSFHLERPNSFSIKVSIWWHHDNTDKLLYMKRSLINLGALLVWF